MTGYPGLKIAYVVDSVEGGGVALPVPSVTRVLRNVGAEVAVFALTRRDGRALPPMLDAGLTVQVRAGSAHNLWAAYRWLGHQLDAYQPTLIFTSLTRATVIGLLLGKRLSVPVICWQHSVFLKPIRQFILYLLRKRPQLWIGDSEQVAALTAQRFEVPDARLLTWSLFSANAQAPQAQPWQPGQVLRLGSLGRLHRQKGYAVLLQALALLKQRGFVAKVPFELVIAGDGDEREALLMAAKKIGFAGLQLPGFVNQPQAFLAGLHLYLQPSRVEGFCIAVHEALQAGLPVIASAVGQIPLTVQPGRSGWLVPPDAAQALADALADALSHPERLAAMGQAGRDYVLARYGEDTFRRSGEQILQRLHERGQI